MARVQSVMIHTAEKKYPTLLLMLGSHMPSASPQSEAMGWKTFKIPIAVASSEAIVRPIIPKRMYRLTRRVSAIRIRATQILLLIETVEAQ